MGKASYKIRETKNMRHFTYSGNLKDAIEKAKRDLQKEKENKEIAQWYWLYEKAKKAINTHNKKIANIEAFIRCAEEEQNKEKLYRLGGNYACVEYGEYEDIKKKRGGAEADKKRHVICISDGCLEEIGEYATKERCLEVLDEIQKACVSYLFTAGGAAVIRGGMDVQPFAAVIPRLYEMPEK